jgi:hypothetical protein
VLNEQDKVDIAALGRAKRKIQEVVEEGRRRKRQSTRSRIARWDTAGKPIRQVVEEAKASETATQCSEMTIEDKSSIGSLPTERDDQALLPMDEQSDADWEISYSLIKSRADISETDEGEMQDG